MGLFLPHAKTVLKLFLDVCSPRNKKTGVTLISPHPTDLTSCLVDHHYINIRSFMCVISGEENAPNISTDKTKLYPETLLESEVQQLYISQRI